MSMIVCELCGTAYPDTGDRCPTCGTEKPVTAEFSASVDQEQGPRGEYTPTKGGRFSHSNVKKRLKNKGVPPVPVRRPAQKPASSQGSKAVREPKPQGGQNTLRETKPPRSEALAAQQKSRAPKAAAPAPRRAAPREKRQEEQNENRSGKGLTILAILLVIAILFMIGYIYVTFFMPRDNGQTKDPDPNSQHQQLPQIPQQTPPSTTEPDLSCSALILGENSIKLNQEGATWLLNVIPEPANTVDAITYVSGDTNVVTVTAEGKVIAVGNGETVITISCGPVKTECKVVCELAPPAPTQPPVTEPPETTLPDIELKLRKEDITFDAKGQSYQLYRGDIPVENITWTTSRSSVATVKDGVVKAVGAGKCTITAEYNGQTVSCIVRCDF